jgi:intraflagellar transport protein 140
MQDSFQRKSPCGTMLGFMVPRVYFRNMTSTVEDGVDGKGGSADKVKVYSKVMRDFIGMDNVNEVTKKALLDFSYNLTLGKLDEAYRAVKTIGSVTIWENMAQMCVKTKRLDVAEVCLGNMGHARGAAAVRESRKEGSVELSIGTLPSLQCTSTAQTAYSITACFSLQPFYWCPS